MKQVLILDADPILRNASAHALTAAGFGVQLAASAQGAVAACEGQKPDIIVLELQLTGHSGVEFLHELLSYPEWQGIPVVLYTMVPERDLQGFDTSFRTLGIVRYAYKPETSLQKLADIVSDVSSLRV